MVKIGNVEIANPVFLAPMAGVTNMAFRKLCKHYGAGLIYTEMVSDKGIVFKNDKTLTMLEIDDSERPVALQLFGNEVETMVEAAKYIDQNVNCDIIDINMGCPAPKIVNNLSGSKLMLNPEKSYNIVKSIVEVVNKPVTVKMRIGWDDSNVNAVEFAKLMESAGASAIAVHGRTTKQGYSGVANWDIISRVKKSVSIPVFGNGDLSNPKDAKEAMEKYGVDAVLVGRAAQGNPFIFKQMVTYYQTGEIIEQSVEERINLCLEHLDALVELKGEKRGVSEMRGQSTWYLKGLPQSAKYKNMLTAAASREEMEEILVNYKNEVGE